MMFSQRQFRLYQVQFILMHKSEKEKEALVEKNKNKNVPIWEKSNLTLTEAAEYFNIGEHKLREITNNHKYNFVLFIGTKRLIKRREFEKYLSRLVQSRPYSWLYV